MVRVTTATVGKWGNALALRLPRAFCRELGIEPGSPVTLELRGASIVIEPADERFTLRGRMRGWDGERYRSEELDWGSPAGDELW